jgi:hypothetical protein
LNGSRSSDLRCGVSGDVTVVMVGLHIFGACRPS